MARINMCPSELLTLAEQLMSCSDTLRRDVYTANQLLLTIDSVWNGTELKSLTTGAHHSTSECLQLSDDLAKLAEYIESASKSYQQAEQSLIQHIEDIL